MDDMMQFYEQFWNKQHDALFAMERNGIALDESKLYQSGVRAYAHLNKLQAELTTWGSDVNWNSDSQVAAFLYDYKGFEIPRYTGTKAAVRQNRERKPVTTDVALDCIANYPDTTAHDRDMLRMLAEYKKHTKQAQFIEKLPRHTVNGRLHTQLAPETETGRLASRNPNLQNIPASKSDVYGIRKAFVPSAGHKLIVCDYSQLELYVLAHYLETCFSDDSLTELLGSADMHTEIAVRCWGESARGVKAKRDAAKTVVYSSLYGKTAAGLGAQITDEHKRPIGRAAGEKLLADFFNGLPGIRLFLDATIDEAKRTGRIRTLLGRYRDISFADVGRGERQCGNTKIQGSAADIVTAAMMRCFSDKLLNSLGVRILLQVHDELIFEVPENNSEKALARIKELMVQPFHRLNIKLVVEGSAANNWSEGK